MRRRAIVLAVAILGLVLAVGVWEVVRDDPPFDTRVLRPQSGFAGSDGYPALRRAFQAVKENWKLANDDWILFYEFEDQHVRSNLTRWLEVAREQVLPELVRAAESDYIEFPGDDAERLYSATLTSTLHTPILEARARLERGDVEGYVQYALVSLDLAAHAHNGNCDQAQYRETSEAVNRALIEIQKGSTHFELEREHLQTLLDRVGALPFSSDAYCRMLLVEYQRFVDIVQQVVAGDEVAWTEEDGVVPTTSFNFKPGRTGNLRARRARHYAQGLTPLYRDCNPEPPDLTPRWSWLRGNQLGTTWEAETRPGWDHPRTSLYTTRARIALTRALLAIAVYELEHGAPPANLRELVPDYLGSVPEDPFDGEPLRYARDLRRVYSVGEDLRDSHGYAPGFAADVLAQALPRGYWLGRRIVFRERQGRLHEESPALADTLKSTIWNDASSLHAVAWTIMIPNTNSNYALSQLAGVPDKPDESAAGPTDPALRLALMAAQQANALTGEEDPRMLDVLARVHYYLGELDLAIQYQSRAVEHCNTADRGDYQTLRDSYIWERKQKAPRGQQ